MRLSQIVLCLVTAAAASAADFPAELTLAQAVERALKRHASIPAAAARVAGAEGLERQAGLRPNPAFFFQSENWRFTGSPGFAPSRELDVFAYISQPLETAGKREWRLELARHDRRIAELEQRLAEWKVRQEVRLAFLRALATQRQLEILTESGGYFQQVIDYHRVRVEQGAMAEADLIKVRLEGERLGLAESTTAAEAERSRLELLRAMGETDLAPRFRLAHSDAIPARGGSLDAAALLERARAGRIEVLLGRAMTERARRVVSLEHAHARPDWTASLGYKRTAGYDTLVAGVSVPLPAFNRNQGNIARSMSEVDRAESLLRLTLSQVEGEVVTALAGLRRRHAMVEQMQKGIVERAEQSWSIALAAYREGGADLLRLLDAQRARNEVQLVYTRIQMDYQINLAELESAVGEENLPIGEELLRAGL